MPINRPDGRHWCDPTVETPGEDGSWTCGECGTTWLFEPSLSVWERPDSRAERIATEAALAEAAATLGGDL